MPAGRSPVDAELVLDANHVHVADAQEIRRPPVGGDVLLLNFKADLRRVVVPALHVVDGHGEALSLGKLGRHGSAQVRRERGDAAPPGQVVPHEGDVSDFGARFHRFVDLKNPLCNIKNRIARPRKRAGRYSMSELRQFGLRGILRCAVRSGNKIHKKWGRLLRQVRTCLLEAA